MSLAYSKKVSMKQCREFWHVELDEPKICVRSRLHWLLRECKNFSTFGNIFLPELHSLYIEAVRFPRTIRLFEQLASYEDDTLKLLALLLRDLL